jgi:hypothetical protein
MEAGVERLVAVVLLLTCASHIAAPRAWGALFDSIAERGEVAGLVHAGIHLPRGLMVVAFHPVGSGAGLLVTLIGWALLVKGTIHLLWPGLASRILQAGDARGRARRLRLAGWVMLPLAIAVAWIAAR